MSLDDDLAACAGIVARGDPARFRATMAAPVALRRTLLPLYAFNLEVARAPQVTREPLIARIRLQWWRDALDEMAAGGRVRRHQVVTPLAAALDARGAADLGDLVAAREADVEGLRPASTEALLRYLDRTAGTLLWTAARLAGAEDEPAIRDAGLAQGVAAWLAARPVLEARGRPALPQGDPAAQVRALAGTGLAALARFRQARPPARAARPVLLVLAGIGPRLEAFRRAPDAQPPEAPVRDRLRLLRASLTGRV